MSKHRARRRYRLRRRERAVQATVKELETELLPIILLHGMVSCGLSLLQYHLSRIAAAHLAPQSKAETP